MKTDKETTEAPVPAPSKPVFTSKSNNEFKRAEPGHFNTDKTDKPHFERGERNERGGDRD
jgi:hypothetical protein